MMLAGSNILVITLGFNFLLIRSSLIGGRVVVKVYTLAELKIFFAHNFFNSMDYGTKNRLCALGVLLNNRVYPTKRVSPGIVDFLIARVFLSCNSDLTTIRALIKDYLPPKFFRRSIQNILVAYKHKTVVELIDARFFKRKNLFVEIEKHNPTVFGSSVLVLPFGLNFVLIRCGLIGGHVVSKVYNLAGLKKFFSRSYSNTMDAATEKRLRGLGVSLNRNVSVIVRVPPGILNFITARIFSSCNSDLPTVRAFLFKYLPSSYIRKSTTDLLIQCKHPVVVLLVGSPLFVEDKIFKDVLGIGSANCAPTKKQGPIA